MSMSIPPTLKAVTQYLRRAERLDKAPEPEAPVVAYYCRLYAVDQAMRAGDNTDAGKSFMLAMINRLEEDKKKGMAQFTEDEGKKMTTDWAMKEFNAADEEDRAGLADQSTARGFYAAGVFFDVLRQFGPPDEEADRRRIYCKWKASQILKAIKEGRTPTPGGAGEDVDTGMPSMGGPGGAGYNAPDSGEQASASAAAAAAAASAAAEANRHDPLAGVIPEAPTDMPYNAPGSSPPADAAGVSALGGPSTPSYPPQSFDTPYDAPCLPAPEDSMYYTQDGGGGGGGGGGAGPLGSMGVLPYAVGDPGPGSSVTPITTPYVAPSSVVPSPYAPPAAPAAQPRYAPAPAPAAAPAPVRPRTPVPSASGTRRPKGAGGRPLEGDLADALEHCRFAIRALEYKDVDLAVQRLHDALHQLT